MLTPGYDTCDTWPDVVGAAWVWVGGAASTRGTRATRGACACVRSAASS